MDFPYLSILSPVWLSFLIKGTLSPISPVSLSSPSSFSFFSSLASLSLWHIIVCCMDNQQSYYDHQPPPDDKPTTMDCSLTMTTTGQPPPDLNLRTHCLSLSLCPLPYYEPHSHPFTFSPGTRLSLADTEFVESPYNHIYGRLPLPTHYIPSTPRMYVGEWD